MSKIQLVNLTIQHRLLMPKLRQAVDRVVASNRFILGEDVEKFETEFAKFCKTKYCIGTGNGTVSIHVALAALGVGPGDEVITVPNTFIATSEVVTQLGARVVFCDIDPLTHTMDVESAASKITKRTKALLPVHIHGNPCQMDKIKSLAKKHGLHVIEDAAQAHGAEYKSKGVGNWGDLATFSFFPAKNLGAWGDAGGVVTNKKSTYQKIKMLVNHGREDKYVHKFEGYNYRLDSLQAAILRVKLPYLKKWNAARRRHAILYNKLLGQIDGVECIKETTNARAVYHLMVICHPQRDKIKAFLASKGVESGVHYPIPLHLQPAYRYLGYKKGSLPVAEKKAKEILSLPMYPELEKKEIERIVAYVKEAIK